jgi:hypothetical protein
VEIQTAPFLPLIPQQNMGVGDAPENAAYRELQQKRWGNCSLKSTIFGGR